MIKLSVSKKPKITIVGAGIIGTYLALTLVRRGYQVCVVEQEKAAGSGVSAKSFGWINTILVDPSGTQHYQRCLNAVQQYQTLNSSLSGSLFKRNIGSLVWHENPNETKSLAELHREAGSEIQLLGEDDVRTLVPQISTPSALAAYSPNDIALDPQQASQTMLEEACRLGAVVKLDTKIDMIRTANGSVSGVQSENAFIESDIVILASGPSIDQLLTEFLSENLTIESPCALITIKAKHQTLQTIVKSPKIEIRSLDSETLIVAKGVKGEATKEALNTLSELVLERFEESFPSIPNPQISSVEVGNRPILQAGNQFVGAIPEVKGLYAAVAHPGVILAPSIADEMLQAIEGR